MYGVIKSVKNSTIEVLQSFTTDGFFTQLFTYCSEILDKFGLRSKELSRKGKIPTKLGEEVKPHFNKSVEDYCKILILFPFIDTLIQEIETRLNKTI